MNRIRPKEVVDAYISTGMGLLQNDYLDGKLACGIEVVVIKRNGGKPVKYTTIRRDYFCSFLNLSTDYIRGFTCGFDNSTPYFSNRLKKSPEYIIGWHDGRLSYLYASGEKEIKTKKGILT